MRKVTIIVETRKYKALPFVLNNAMSILSNDWNLQIFHSSNNLDYIEELIEKDKLLNTMKDRIIFNCLSESNILKLENTELEDRNSSLFLTEEFWESVVSETILQIECDTILCPSSKNKIEDFKHFDYIGGYWGNVLGMLDSDYSRVMNGGLSVRKKSFMLDIIKNELQPYLDRGGNSCEDYFVSACVRNKPTVREVLNFSIDCGYMYPLDNKAPFGLHKPWGTTPSKGHGRYYDEIKKVCREVEILKSLQYIEEKKTMVDSNE